MGAKPNKSGSAAKVPAKKSRAPARRVPARRASSKSGRTSREQTVDSYVAGLDGDLADVAGRLRALVMGAAPSASESIKWGQPVYEDNGPFCYFKASTGHVTFGFWRGTELDDPEQRLEGDGDRMKHIKLRSLDDVDDEAVGRWVRQAVDLNWRLGSPTRQASQGAVEAAEAEAPRSVWPPSSADGDESQELADEPTRTEPVKPIEGVIDQTADRFHDDDSFEPAWKR